MIQYCLTRVFIIHNKLLLLKQTNSLLTTTFFYVFQEISDKQKQREEAEKAIAEQKAPTGDMTKARIQFKLPTGGSVAETFDATSTLGMLRSYVVQNLTLPFKQFTMTSSFPRRDLTAADDQKTLLELELVPSSVILILPVKGVSILYVHYN